MAGNERLKTNQLYASFIARQKYEKRRRTQMDTEKKGELRNSIREYIKTLKK